MQLNGLAFFVVITGILHCNQDQYPGMQIPVVSGAGFKHYISNLRTNYAIRLKQAFHHYRFYKINCRRFCSP
jgi:hypothetical protein